MEGYNKIKEEDNESEGSLNEVEKAMRDSLNDLKGMRDGVDETESDDKSNGLISSRLSKGLASRKNAKEKAPVNMNEPQQNVNSNEDKKNTSDTNRTNTIAARTEPLKANVPKRRRLERQSVTSMPEIHFVGQILSGSNIVMDNSEGAFVKYKVDFGKAWELLGGSFQGQTHVAYPFNTRVRDPDVDPLVFNHPLDCHFAEVGLQGWGAPRISLQVYRMDWCGRKILAGYGFAHLPMLPGCHKLEIPLWRPIGTNSQELKAFMLGDSPALVSSGPIYESAWKERCKIMTTAAGAVEIELFVITRFLSGQNVDQH